MSDDLHTYKITHSLLYAWKRMLSDDATEEHMAQFMNMLNGIETPRTAAMQEGLDFEAEVYKAAKYIGAGLEYLLQPEDVRQVAAEEFGNIINGGIWQLKVSKQKTIDGLDFMLVGVFDAVKCGTIYDIKRVFRYEYGRFYDFTQHPMYFELLPDAESFTYLIFDGYDTHYETYSAEDTASIDTTISEFIRWLREQKLLDVYKDNWNLTKFTKK